MKTYTNILKIDAAYSDIFWFYRTDGQPKGATHYIIKPPLNAEPHPTDNNLVRLYSTAVTLNGGWKYECKLNKQGTIYNAISMNAPWRHKATYRVTATEDNSSLICIEPRDGEFWDRQLHILEKNSEKTIEKNCEHSYLFVLKGTVIFDKIYSVNSVIKTHHKGQTTIKTYGDSDAVFVEMWK
jgi:hypothetical protein